MNSLTSSFELRLKDSIKSSKFSQKELAKEIDISENSLTNYLSGKRTPDVSVVSKIAQLCDIDLNWLLTGKKDVLPEEKSIPLINHKAQAGSLSIFDESHQVVTSQIKVPDIVPNSNIIAIEVEGDSMSPTIPERSFIVGERIFSKEHLWKDYIYIFACKDGLLIKRFHSFDNGFYTLTSDNTHYSDLHIHEDDITDILKVRRMITGNFSGKKYLH